MSYRDDRDADQARIAALEADLASANRRIAELEGRGAPSTALVPTRPGALTALGPNPNPWYGAPLKLERSHVFDGEYPRDELENLIGFIRSTTRDHGRAELLKSSITWSAGTNPRQTGPFTVVTVSVRDGQTSLLVTDTLGQLAGGLYGGLGGGLGGGAIMIPILAALSMPVLIPVTVSVWFGSVFLGTRAIFKRAAHRRAAALGKLFLALFVEIEARLLRVRGETPPIPAVPAP